MLFERAWELRRRGSEARREHLKNELQRIESDVGRLIDRIVETSAPTVAAALEKRVRDLEERKLIVGEQIANCGRPVRSFEESVRTPLNFLANPWLLWNSGELTQRRALLKLAFQERPRYARNEGFRTPNLALPFKLLEGFAMPELVMASQPGQSSNPEGTDSEQETLSPETAEDLFSVLEHWDSELKRLQPEKPLAKAPATQKGGSAP